MPRLNATCETIGKTNDHDSRFNSILNRAREIKELSRDLSEISFQKIGDLLGEIPREPDCKEAIDPVCWADRVIYEQDFTLTILREVFSRISTL